MEGYLKELNREQLEAVRHEEGPCMVLAGPGTGKTTVITSRIVNLIKDRKVSPENMLVVTFSRAAANEMKERYMRLYGNENKGGITIGTFHSVFFRLLRQYKGYKLENLIDENQKFVLIKNMVKGLGEGFFEDEEQIKDIISDLEYMTSTMADADSFRPVSCDRGIFRRIIGEYDEFKLRTGKYDYDDILNHCLHMLKGNPGILKETREKFKYIMVDEFQDINALQFEAIKLIAEPLNNLFIVGDDDQSIYGFRGAEPDILLNFERLYPSCKKICLKYNYRTTESILNAALSVIDNNKNRYSKKLEAVNGNGSPPVTFEVEDFEEEARMIASRIGQMNKNGREFSDFAVIYRTNLQSRAIIDAFMDVGIPFVTLDGIVSMYNHWIFKDVMSYLKLGTNLGGSRDVIRIINKPRRYISKDVMARADRLGGDLLQNIISQGGLNRLQANSIHELCSDLKRLKSMTSQNAVRYIRNVIGYDEYLKEYAASKGISAKGLMEMIEEIESSARRFQSILNYMEHVDTVAEKLAEKDYDYSGRNNVKLLTMHKAKGLEFDTVFICGSVEGLTPYIKEDSDGDNFEEERRLYYVAMTRAKKELYITVPKRRYGKPVKPSRFVEEFRNSINYRSQVRIGQRVFHKIYFSGVIKDIIDSRDGVRIKVDFEGNIKELNLKTCLNYEIIRLL